MAKKLRKVPASPVRVLIEILIPWLFMAFGAIVGSMLGLGSAAAVAVALAFGLLATAGVYLYERRRRLAKLRRTSRG